MGAMFESETVNLTKGQSLMEVLKEALKKQSLAARLEDGFIIDDVHILSIEGDKTVCRVDYEYGG